MGLGHTSQRHLRSYRSLQFVQHKCNVCDCRSLFLPNLNLYKCILRVKGNEYHKYLHTCMKYINNCPTRCNTKQSIYYSASSLYMFRVSTTPIIRRTQNCDYSFRYWSYFLCSYLPPTWPSQLGGRQLHKKYDQYRRLQLQFCVLLMMGVDGTRNRQSELAE